MKKDRAAVTLGRKGGLKGGIARAANLTAEQRSASARKAVRARWAKAGKPIVEDTIAVNDTSNNALAALLTRFRIATDLTEIQMLSEKIERLVFHKQFENAQDPAATAARHHETPPGSIP